MINLNIRRVFTHNNPLNQNRKIAVITGGTAQMAPSIAKAAALRGYEILNFTRRLPPEKSDFRWEKIDDLANVDRWTLALQKHTEGASKVVLINTLGTAVAPNGKTLKDVNELPVLAAVEALKKLKIEKAIGHISTIAATYLPTDPEFHKELSKDAVEYSLGRHRVDLILKDSGIPTTILRPGIVFNDVHNGKYIDNGHDYSPEQLTSLPVHPLIGSGKQINQPVYLGDLVEALLNGVESGETHLVDAVGPIALTQEDMVKFFTDLAGRPFKPIQIPAEVAAFIAKYFPKGRLAPYSVSMLDYLENNQKEPLCHRAFEKLVGKPLTSFEHVYQMEGGKTYHFPSSPIYEHTKEILNGILANPDARKDFFRIVKKYGPSLIVDALKLMID